MPRGLTVIDKLVLLARGDVELVQRAISRASRGADTANLGEVTKLVLAMREPSTPSPEPERPTPIQPLR